MMSKVQCKRMIFMETLICGLHNSTSANKRWPPKRLRCNGVKSQNTHKHWFLIHSQRSGRCHKLFTQSLQDYFGQYYDSDNQRCTSLVRVITVSVFHYSLLTTCASQLICYGATLTDRFAVVLFNLVLRLNHCHNTAVSSLDDKIKLYAKPWF